MNAQSGETLLEISPDEFARTVDDLERDGYRLLMIKPADGPYHPLLREVSIPPEHSTKELSGIPGKQRGIR